MTWDPREYFTLRFTEVGSGRTELGRGAGLVQHMAKEEAA